MKPDLRKKIIAFNTAVKEKGKRASDLDVLISKFSEIPPGQLKKVLTEDILLILENYGVML